MKKARCEITDIEDSVSPNLAGITMIARKQLEILRKWRFGKVADVDIYGCDKLAEPTADAKTKRFQILVSLLFSSQTRDPITAGAVKRLQNHVEGLTPKSIRSCEEAELAELIKPVGFYKMKAGYLKKISIILGKEYDDDIPKTLEELTKLPGIGPKMAYLTMQCAWNECIGIGVDVHVHRISERLGWTQKSACKTPEDTRKLAQTRQQQQEAAEKARLSVGEYEKISERRIEERRAAFAAVEKEERRHEMETFYSYVALIRSKIKSIDEGRDDLWRISSQSMVTVSDDQVADLSARLELISARTNKNSEEIRGLLKELSERNEALVKKHGTRDSACMRIRLVQVDALTRKFTSSIGAFESTENLIQSKSKELLERRLKIVAPDMENSNEITAILEASDNVNVFALAGGVGQEELERKLEHLRAQQRSMQRLEKNILTLNKMFLDMQNLVRQQDDQLNHVEAYVQKTVEFQKAAELDKAIELQKNIRKVSR